MPNLITLSLFLSSFLFIFYETNGTALLKALRAGPEHPS